MEGILLNAGFCITSTATAAVAIVLNGCTAKTPAHDQFLSALHRARAAGVAVVAAGCTGLSALAAASSDPGIAILGVDQLPLIAQAVRAAIDRRKFVAVAREQVPPSLTLPIHPHNECIATVVAATGCLDHCAYCKTVAMRGRLRSHPVAEVVAAVVRRVSPLLTEIRLTGEDMGAYGLDIGESLPSLLRAVIAGLEGVSSRAMIRVGMANPQHVLRYVDEFAALLAHPLLFSFVHIPIQCGSDRVLQAMGRRYTVADFEHVVAAIRRAVPNVTIATDIICGFPTETAEDFAQTLELIARHHFPIVNINGMFARPGTAAASMRPLPTKEVRRRVKALSDLYHSYTSFDKLVGTTTRVWVAEMAHDGIHWAAHTKEYVQVLLDNNNPEFIRPGASLDVRIVSASKWSVIGIPTQL